MRARAHPYFRFAMVQDTRFLSLLRTSDLEVVRIDADYDAPYEVNDHEAKPSISFVQQGVFRYTAGRNSAWLHGGACWWSAAIWSTP